MSLYISLLNNMAVSFFGGILSASFCNALSTRKRKLIFIGCMVLLPLIQSILYFSKGADFVRHIYPLAVHLPLVIVLWMLTGKLLWSVFSVQAAYLCCELRRWVALATVAAFSGRQMMQGQALRAVPQPDDISTAPCECQSFKQGCSHERC